MEFLQAVDEPESLDDAWTSPDPDAEATADKAAHDTDEQQQRTADRNAETIADAFKDKRRRPRKAAEYERKAIGPIRALARKLAGKRSTKPDAAVLLATGPGIARALGDIAADNPNVARILDMGSDVTESPTGSLVSESLTLALQVIRNHEDALAPGAERVVTMRGGRRFRLPRWFGVRIPTVFRDVLTDDPEALAHAVFTNERIRKITDDWYVAE